MNKTLVALIIGGLVQFSHMNCMEFLGIAGQAAAGHLGILGAGRLFDNLFNRGQQEEAPQARGAAEEEDRVYQLHDAAVNRDAEYVAQLLAQGQRINRQNQIGETALMAAARVGNTAVMRQLLAHGANANIRNDRGETALMYAVDANHLEAVRILVRHAEDVAVQEDVVLQARENTNNPAIRRLLANIVRMHCPGGRVRAGDLSEDEDGRHGAGPVRHEKYRFARDYQHRRREAQEDESSDVEILSERGPRAAAAPELPMRVPAPAPAPFVAGDRVSVMRDNKESEQFDADLARALELSRRDADDRARFLELSRQIDTDLARALELSRQEY